MVSLDPEVPSGGSCEADTGRRQISESPDSAAIEIRNHNQLGTLNTFRRDAQQIQLHNVGQHRSGCANRPSMIPEKTVKFVQRRISCYGNIAGQSTLKQDTGNSGSINQLPSDHPPNINGTDLPRNAALSLSPAKTVAVHRESIAASLATSSVRINRQLNQRSGFWKASARLISCSARSSRIENPLIEISGSEYRQNIDPDAQLVER